MADTNSTGINELEEKKWLISRIDLYHKTAREAFESELQTYENFAEKALSASRGSRNSILSGLGVILTVVLGINAAYSMGQILFFSILTVLGVASLVTLIIFNMVNRILENLVSSLYAILNDDISKLATSQAYIITSVAHISTTSLQYVNNYFTFTMLLSFAIAIHESKELKKIAKQHWRIPNVKSRLMEIAKSYEKNSELIPKLWTKFDSTQLVYPELLEFVNKTLEDYKPKN